MSYVWLVLGSFFTGIIKDKQNILSLCSFLFWHTNRQKTYLRANIKKANEIFLTVTNFGAV